MVHSDTPGSIFILHRTKDLDVDGIRTLKWIFKKWDVGTDWIDLAEGEVRVASRRQEIVSFASQGVLFTCIISVPSCQPQTWRFASRG